MKKRNLLLTTTLLLAALSGSEAGAQSVADYAEAPKTSTEGDTTWYYLVSAAKENIPNSPNQLPQYMLPMYEHNFVLSNTAQVQNNYIIREAKFNDQERFAIVNVDGVPKLINRQTKGYMNQCWGSNATGEKFEAVLISGTTNQYMLRTYNGTAARTPLWIANKNGTLTANRYGYDNGGAQNANKPTAWYFVSAYNEKAVDFMKTQHQLGQYAVKPEVSTVENPTWYYIVSAATQTVPGDGSGIASSLFPMYERNLVLTNKTQTEANYTFREAQFTEEEMFAIVNVNGVPKLLNRKTGGYMVESWGSNATGEKFEAVVIPGTNKRQYALRTNSGSAWRSPMWFKKINGVLTANRYGYDKTGDNLGAKNADKTTAFYFIPVTDTEAAAFMKHQQTATQGKDAYTNRANARKACTAFDLTYTDNAATPLTAYHYNKTQANADALLAAATESTTSTMTAIRTIENKYYRIRNEKYSTYMGLRPDVEGTEAFAVAKSDADAHQIWQVVYNESADKFQLKNCNLDLYLGKTLTGSTTTSKLEATAGNYTIAKSTRNTTGLILHDEGNYDLQSEEAGHINGWNENGTGNASWLFEEATSIDVNLHDVTGDAAYATTYLPFAVSAAEGATMYTGTVSGTAVMLTQATDGVAARNAIILRGTEGTATATLTLGQGTATSTGITGTCPKKDVEAKSVLTMGNQSGIGFFTFTGTSLRANSAYIDNNSGTQAAGLRFTFDDITAIDGLTLTTGADSEGTLYDLSGRRVNRPVKGRLYIRNGAKYMAR